MAQLKHILQVDPEVDQLTEKNHTRHRFDHDYIVLSSLTPHYHSLFIFLGQTFCFYCAKLSFFFLRLNIEMIRKKYFVLNQHVIVVFHSSESTYLSSFEILFASNHPISFTCFTSFHFVYVFMPFNFVKPTVLWMVHVLVFAIKVLTK